MAPKKKNIKFVVEKDKEQEDAAKLVKDIAVESSKKEGVDGGGGSIEETPIKVPASKPVMVASNRGKIPGSSDRHDGLTGSLKMDPVQPSHSASGIEKFYVKPEYKDHPLAPPQIMTLTATLGGGKSSTIYNVLREITSIVKPEKLGDVVYYSGSPGDKILDAYSSDRVDKYGPDSVESFLGHIRRILSESSIIDHDDKKRHIIVLDDAMDSSFMGVKNGPIQQLMISARHLPATLIMSAHRYTLLPTLARTLSSTNFIWKSKSEQETRTISNDMPFGKKEFVSALETLGPQEFLMVNKANSTINRGFSRPLIH